MNYLINDLISKSRLSLKTKPDCDKLSDYIFEEINENISTQTLRRILGLVKTTTKPTLNTLDILSRYIGFDSYNSYILEKGNQHIYPVNIQLITMLFRTPLQEVNQNGISQLFRTISKYIYDCPEIIAQLDDDTISQETFRYYFIERYPSYDLYNHGLDAVLNKMKTIYKEDHWFQLFIDSTLLLCKSSSITKKGFINQYSSFSEKPTKDVHPFLIGRYFGMNYIIDERKKERKKIQEEVINIFSSNETSPLNKFCILLTYVESLIYTKSYRHGFELIEKYWDHKIVLANWMDYGYKEVIKVFHFICLFNIGNPIDAKGVERTINLDTIPFYFKQHYSNILKKEKHN